MDKIKLYYLLGALRDANLDIRMRKNYEIKFCQKDVLWLEHVSDIIFDLFGKRYIPKKNMLRITDKKIVYQIKQLSEIISPQVNWKTPKMLKNEKNIVPYIQGFWDAEDGLPKNPLEAKQKYLSFDQKNKSALSFIRKKLMELGFTPTNLTFTHEVWQFRLTRKKDIHNYIYNIKSSHPEKYSRMLQLV